MRYRLKHILRQDFARPLLPALLVFIALMVIIGVSWKTARQDISTQEDSAVSENAAFVESALRQRFSIYEDTLRSANGLFLSSDFVSRSEWKSFVDSMQLPARYPGVRSVGYIKLVSQADRDAYVASVVDEGIDSFHIYPAGDRAVYAPATYIVPTAGQNTSDRTAPGLGYDMYTDPIRKRAMDQAALSGQPALSGVVNLMQSAPGSIDGFVLFMPTYDKDMPQTTSAERVAALSGFFYAPFATDDVFASLFNLKEPAFGFTISDSSQPIAKRIYSSATDIDKPYFSEARQDGFNLYGQNWTIAYSIKKEIVPYSLRARPLSAVVGGSIFAGALALIIYLLIQRRTRALSYYEEKKLEEAKDELLSLASHQLRTPATAVKQYVSMVKEGFAGPITTEQRKMLQMAYESNERQLTIVDDLLYVARVDAGKAALKLEPVNITALLQSVISEQESITKNRHQKVIYVKPARAVTIKADPQYLRMIFENLLSNASKYSYERTKIGVTLTRGKGNIRINFADHGVGIESEDYGAVFLKFSRIPNELSRHIAGSGIGLYLAKQLALLHGGDITFISAPGNGSTFTVTLPKEQ